MDALQGTAGSFGEKWPPKSAILTVQSSKADSVGCSFEAGSCVTDASDLHSRKQP
jgi:hypothetical protein